MRPLQDGTQRTGVRMYAKGKALTDDTRMLQRVKDVLGLPDREIGERILGCKRELVTAYLNGRARMTFTPAERERLAEIVSSARQALALIEMEL